MSNYLFLHSGISVRTLFASNIVILGQKFSEFYSDMGSRFGSIFLLLLILYL